LAINCAVKRQLTPHAKVCSAIGETEDALPLFNGFIQYMPANDLYIRTTQKLDGTHH
jgi:hypothetical protein